MVVKIQSFAFPTKVNDPPQIRNHAYVYYLRSCIAILCKGGIPNLQILTSFELNKLTSLLSLLLRFLCVS